MDYKIEQYPVSSQQIFSDMHRQRWVSCCPGFDERCLIVQANKVTVCGRNLSSHSSREERDQDVHIDTRGHKVIKYGEHLSHCPVPLWRSRCFSNNQDPQWANGIFFYLKELDEFTLQNRHDRYGGCEFKDCKVRPYLKTKTEPGNPGLWTSENWFRR